MKYPQIEFPLYPDLGAISSKAFANLEAQYVGRKLLCGRCPHMGTPVSAMATDSHGRLVCPLHGLRFRDGVVVRQCGEAR